MWCLQLEALEFMLEQLDRVVARGLTFDIVFVLVALNIVLKR